MPEIDCVKKTTILNQVVSYKENHASLIRGNQSERSKLV